jgi:hypothetical protein
MNHTYKAKVAHLLDNGDKLELEAFVDADSHDAAFALARNRLRDVVGRLAAAGTIEIDKSKIELGAAKP